MMKVTVLYLALYCNKRREKIETGKEIGKICIASFIGTLIEIIGLLLGCSYSVFVIIGHFLQVPLMTSFVLGKDRRKMLQIVITGYFFTMLINGVLEALWNQFGEHGGYLFYLLFSCAAVIVGVRMWKNYTKMQKGIVQVQLSHQGNQIQIKGFYDSGNLLQDPYTGKGVHIILEQRVRELGILRMGKEMEKSEEQKIILPVHIPYHALGSQAGLLEVYYIDEMIIDGEKGRITIHNCPVGVTKDNLFEGKKYEMILNEEVF